MKSQLSRFSSGRSSLLPIFAAICICTGVSSVRSGEVNNRLVSKANGPAGAIGNAESDAPDMTPDGKLVVFESDATNLIPGVTGHQVYLRNLTTETLELISVNVSGTPGNGASYQARISANGRFVVFTSNSTDLVAGDTNGQDDIFIRDRQSATTTRVSLTSTGGQTDAPSFQPRISGDGRFVLFESRATNLVAGDTNSMSDGFLVDRQANTIERVTLTSTGAEIIGSIGGRNEPTGLSDDGNFIVFLVDSDATNVVPNDTNNSQDIFLRDRAAGTTTRLSVNANGEEGNNHSIFPAISRDGSTIAFTSFASNLVPGDDNGVADVFVLRRLTNTLTRITNGNGDCAQVSISSDGRFVAFSSKASNLVSDDTNGQNDQFIWDGTTGAISLLSRASDGSPGNGPSGSQELPGTSVFCCEAHVSDDGRFIVYDSAASNLVPGDNNNAEDIFVHDRAPDVIARAGADQTVLEGSVVTLDGSTSVGTGLTYAWNQIAGPAIADGVQNGTQFTFTAPTVVNTTVVTLQLVVTSSTGSSSFDTVDITVQSSDGGGVDTDFDGITDDQEKAAGTNPKDPNSKPGGTADFDHDGIPDDIDPDDDNDGWTDAQEWAAGTNPYDATSHPNGPPPILINPLPITITKAMIKISFTGKGDSASVTGNIDLPANFTPANTIVSLVVGDNIVSTYNFDAKGKAKGAKFTYKKPKKGQTFAGGPGKVSASAKGLNLSALNVPNQTTKTGTMPVQLGFVINNQGYASTVNMNVKSKQGNSATLKFP